MDLHFALMPIQCNIWFGRRCHFNNCKMDAIVVILDPNLHYVVLPQTKFQFNLTIAKEVKSFEKLQDDLHGSLLDIEMERFYQFWISMVA